MIQIEQLNEWSVDQVAKMSVKLWPDNDFQEMREEFQQLISSAKDIVYAALADGRYIGFIHMSLRTDYVEGSQSSPVGYIEAIYVEETFRKQGVSRRLVEAGERWAASLGCSEIGSDTELSNVASQQFHQKLGFAEANRIVSFIKPIDSKQMSEVTTIFVVRHGQTEWNVEHKLQGHQDSPLTALGVKQAEWLAEALEDVPIDHIYASSSDRALKTAQIVKGARTLPVIASNAFKEISLGVWEGKTQDEAKQLFPEQFEYFWNDPDRFAVPGSETFQAVSQRAIDELNQLIDKHRGETILIVTHTVVVKLIMAHFEQRRMEDLWQLPYIYPACLCKIELRGDKPHIVLHGDIAHYKEEASPS